MSSHRTCPSCKRVIPPGSQHCVCSPPKSEARKVAVPAATLGMSAKLDQSGPPVGWLVDRAFPPIPLHAGELTIGRDMKCGLVLPHNAISRRHAVLRCSAESLVVEDAGSSNGTAVGGRKLKGALALQAGDVLELGPYHLKVKLPDEPPAAKPAPARPAPAAARPAKPAPRPAPEEEEEAADEPVTEVTAQDGEVSGPLDRVDMADLLQLLEMRQKTGTLIIETPSAKGRLIVVNGKPTSAKFGGQTDEAAVLAMARQQQGVFRFRSVIEEKVATTMSGTLSQVVARLVRQDAPSDPEVERKASETQRFSVGGGLLAAAAGDDEPEKERPCRRCGAMIRPGAKACPACRAPARR